VDAILYIRISELTDATTSPERQKAECQAYAERKGWDVVGAFEDLDISGTKSLTARPGMVQALEAIEAGEAEVLVAYKIDRVARSIVTFHEIVGRVQGAGGSLVLVSESIDFSTPMGMMVANVLASFAEFESQTIGARVSAAKRHLQSQGKWGGGRRPYGWQPAPHTSGKGFVLELHPEESVILGEMAERVLAGEALSGIAGDLNRRGAETALGNTWAGHTVRQALTKKAMTGRDGAEGLVDDATYAKLQHQLQRAEPQRRILDHPETLLGPDLLQCGKCGAPMKPATASDRKRVYKCSTRPPAGMSGCFLTASAKGVDQAVGEFILETLGGMEVELPATTEVHDPAATERAEVKDRLTELETDRYVRGLFSSDDGAERFQRIYADLEQRLSDLPGLQAVETEVAAIPTGKAFGQAWEEADTETRSGWLSTMLHSVEVAPGKGGRRFDPERLTIRWAP
jgi:site-specific DNA recombinase